MPLANVTTPYLTIAEVAASLRVSRMTVYRLVRAHTPGRGALRKVLPHY